MARKRKHVVGFSEDTTLADVAGFLDDATVLVIAAQIERSKADKLIREFGSLGGVLAAPNARLVAAGADHDAANRIKAMHVALARVLRADVKAGTVLSSWSGVLDYLRASMAFEGCEQFRLLFLDKRNQLIADEVQQHGTVDHTPVYPREVVKRALELNATAIILTHNHPSGDPAPSRADIDMTQAIIECCKPLGIAVHDHIIIGKHGHASLKGLRLI